MSKSFSKNFKGKFGEYIAQILYRICFYKILGSRVRNRLGEVDFIAQRFNTLVFVEVKTRIVDLQNDFIVTLKQQRRIINAAKMFIHNNSKYRDYQVRFDVVIVRNYFFPMTIKNAFIAEY